MTSERAAARAELERRAMCGPASLMDWIPWARPHEAKGWGGPPYRAPRHLSHIVEVLDSAECNPVRAVLSVPPRHAKTDTLLAWMVKRLQRNPRRKIAYFSYGADFAATRCARAKRLALHVGIQLAGRDREDYFETAEGGFLRSEGIQGQHSGMGYDDVVVDDPHKDQAEADSVTVRERVCTAFGADLWSRQQPTGTSFVVCAARRHPEDLPGLLKARGWPYVGLPAIDDRDGTERALWPEGWPLEKLHEIRDAGTMGRHEWSALYLGAPVPRGGAVFDAPTYCTRDAIPTQGIRAGFGLDGAYSTKSHADYSVFLVLVRGPVERDKRPVYYVADVLRVQKSQPDFVAAVKPRVAEWPGIRGGWYTSTTERGNADLMSAMGLPVEAMPATSDKFARAQAVSAAWNAGRIRVPRDAPWAADFVAEVARFTGIGDAHDDQVDALAAAYDRAVSHDTSGYIAMVRGMKAMSGRR